MGELVVGLKKPQKRQGGSIKHKCLAANLSSRDLQNVAEKATFVPSVYHCPDPKSGRPVWRPKPATPCPGSWSRKEGMNAVKSAIINGHVSGSWVKGFPRHIWHKRDGIWYEARTAVGTAGEYHGYPTEPNELPAGLLS